MNAENDNYDDMTLCVFCKRPIGEDPIMDDACNFACRSCGQAELATQKREGFVRRAALNEEG